MHGYYNKSKQTCKQLNSRFIHQINLMVKVEHDNQKRASGHQMSIMGLNFVSLDVVRITARIYKCSGNLHTVVKISAPYILQGFAQQDSKPDFVELLHSVVSIVNHVPGRARHERLVFNLVQDISSRLALLLVDSIFLDGCSSIQHVQSVCESDCCSLLSI